MSSQVNSVECTVLNWAQLLCQIFLNNGKVEEFRNRFSFETSQPSHEMKWLQLQLIFVFFLQSLIRSVFLCLSQSNRLGPCRVPSRWNKFDSTIFVLFLFTANQPTQNPSASIALPVLVEKENRATITSSSTISRCAWQHCTAQISQWHALRLATNRCSS